MKDNLSNSQEWRAKLLQRVLWIVAFAALPSLVMASLTTSWPVFLVYLLIYLTILAITIFPVPYVYRAWIGISLSYLTALGNLLERVYDGGVLFLLAANVLSMLWLETRPALLLTGIGLALPLPFFLLELQAKEFATKSILHYGILWYFLTYLTLLTVFSSFWIIRTLNEQFSKTRQQKDELEQIRASLEEQVAERTAELEQRARSLSIAAEVTRQLSMERDLASLLSLAVRLLRTRFGLPHAGIFLLDETRRYAILQTYASDEGVQGEEGYRIEIASNVLLEQLVAQKRAILSQEQAQFLPPLLPETRAELLLPLLSRGEGIGVLDVRAKDAQAFLPEAVDVFQGIADAMAMAIENARLFSEMQLALQQLQAISGAEVRQAWRKFSTHPRGYRYTPLGLYPLEQVAPSDGREGVEIPLRLRGQTVGVLRLKRKATGQPWSEQEQALAQRVAEQVALALENARLLEQTRQRAERERILSEITARVRETLDMETILRRAADETRAAFALPEVFIQILPEETLEPPTDRTAGENP